MSVYVWGFGKLGQLGTGDTKGRIFPEKIKINDNCCAATIRDRPVQVYTGGLFSAFLTLKGDIYVCGCGKYGRLGTGSEDNVIKQPTKISIGKDTKVTCLATGSWHSCAVTFLGRLYSWGYNSKHSVLGRDCDLISSLSPGLVSIFNDIPVKSVACGHNFTLVTTINGNVYSWGCGRYGVLGHGNEQCLTRPKLIDTIRNIKIKSINCGYAHSGLITEDGRLYMFGKGSDGALGFGTDLENKTEPIWLQYFLTTPIIMVSCSVGEHRGHTLAISSDGHVYAWGSNHKGKLGLGDQNQSLEPVKIDQKYFGNQSIIKISAGGVHSGAITENGLVYTWGCGKDGRLGHTENHTTTNNSKDCQKSSMITLQNYYVTLPKQVTHLPENRRAVDISCSHYHTILLMELI